MRTPIVYAALLAVSASLLAGCSSAAPTPSAAPTLPAPAGSSATSAPAPATSTAAGRDSRGFIPKQLGQDGSIGASDGSDARMMAFSVDKITVDPKCSQYGSRDAGTHTVVLDMRVSTTKLADRDASMLAGLFNPFAFQVYDAEGVSHSSQADMCANRIQSAPNAFASNSKYRFQVAFSTDTAPVEVVLMSSDGRGAEGWVWKVS